MDDYDSGQWDALFSGDEVVRGEGSSARPLNIEDYCEVPGVKAAVLVGMDGVLQAHTLQGSPEQAAAITAYLGASARQAGAAMAYQNFDHATLNFGDSGDPVLVFRRGSSFVGLLLEQEIAASHILTRVRGLSEG